MRSSRRFAWVAITAFAGLARCATSTGTEADAGPDVAPKPDASDASVDQSIGDDAVSSSDASRDVSTDDGAAIVDVTSNAKLVFTTSQTYTGNLGGLSGADAKCQALATQANLAGTYKAWLSDATGTPITRFTHSTIPYTLVDGTVIASDWTALISGTLQHAIDLSESNGPPGKDNSGLSLPSGVTLVWTSTKYDGTLVPNTTCQAWTSASSSDPSEWGRDDATNVDWSQWASSGSCGWTAPLMCFQQ